LRTSPALDRGGALTCPDLHAIAITPDQHFSLTVAIYDRTVINDLGQFPRMVGRHEMKALV